METLLDGRILTPERPIAANRYWIGMVGPVTDGLTGKCEVRVMVWLHWTVFRFYVFTSFQLFSFSVFQFFIFTFFQFSQFSLRMLAF